MLSPGWFNVASCLVLFQRCLLNVTVTCQCYIFLFAHMSITSCNCNMNQYIRYNMVYQTILLFIFCLSCLCGYQTSYTTRRYMTFAVTYAIKTRAKKKPEKIPEFQFFRFLFHNYLNCICNGEDCITISLLMTAGQFLHRQ